MNLSSESRIKKLLEVVKENKIVLMEGRLEPHEEAALIQRTMEDVSKEFRGIELCTVYPDKKRNQNKNVIKDMIQRFFIGNRIYHIATIFIWVHFLMSITTNI